AGPHQHAGRHRRRRALPGQRARRLHQRPGHPGGRRPHAELARPRPPPRLPEGRRSRRRVGRRRRPVNPTTPQRFDRDQRRLPLNTFIKTTLAAVAAATALAAAAQSEPGLTDKSIRIGMFSPLSGNSMAYGFDVVNAAKMYYDKVNKEGGIHGRKIDIVLEDDRCNANDLLAAVKKLTEQDKVFLLNGGSCSGPVVGAREYVEREKIPLVMLNAS